MLKGKASNYDSLKTDAIIRYGNEYIKNISEMFNEICEDVNRTKLKSIVANLETVEKMLKEITR